MLKNMLKDLLQRQILLKFGVRLLHHKDQTQTTGIGVTMALALQSTIKDNAALVGLFPLQKLSKVISLSLDMGYINCPWNN